MKDYVIKRDKKRCLKHALFLGLLGGFFHYFFVKDPPTSSDKFIFILAIFFCYFGAVIYLANACFSRSEILRLTSEGFYFSGYGLGLKVYVVSWEDVESIFFTEIVVPSRGGRNYHRYISVNFKDSETWLGQFQSYHNFLGRFLVNWSKKNLRSGDLDIALVMSDHSDKQIHDVIDLMRKYHQQALVKERKP